MSKLKRSLKYKPVVQVLAPVFLLLFIIISFEPFSLNTAKAEISQMPVKTDVTIFIFEFDMETSKPITQGKYTFPVKNLGSMVHEVVVFKLDPGVTSEEFISVVGAGGSLRKVGRTKGNMPPIESNTTGSLTATFESGNYLLLCFRVDKETKEIHFMKGMLHEITIQ